jgi:hypothetical protein
MGECEQIVTKDETRGVAERNLKYKGGNRPLQGQPRHVSAGKLCFRDGAVLKTKLK